MQCTIVPVTADNQTELAALHVSAGQEGFIETVEECLSEARSRSVWRPVGIYADGVPVGFAMYGYWPKGRRAWLDRLLIDGRYQHRGYGRAAVALLLDRIRREYPKAYLVLAAGGGTTRHLDLLQRVADVCRERDKDTRVGCFVGVYTDADVAEGADGHPSSAGHRQLAEQLTAYLKETLNW